ncbi:hypothetical protein DERF_004155 [Dermatophagoides farinae]|uniref:Uncharacterized protein n=1 Tax=Dermatophagoides farinae TaxID=6954 RepID=A0A922IG36_DERFA|nr:hypothetical protein DERF_004155 [Dermatophagoides farinae]
MEKMFRIQNSQSRKWQIQTNTTSSEFKIHNREKGKSDLTRSVQNQENNKSNLTRPVQNRDNNKSKLTRSVQNSKFTIEKMANPN